jgi:hypothetical protein
MVFVAASIGMRGVLVEYVGDIAAYVSPQWLDRFNELRQRIKNVACTTTRAIYDARSEDGSPLYKKVVIAGHSLGSVIAYDTVNSLCVEDQGGAARGVGDRTRALVTFGSPLDKTAFIFGVNGLRTGILREMLAAAVQPLIDSYSYRRFEWLNLWTRADLVSGSLRFYDWPIAGVPLEAHVRNIEDPGATTPLAAHIEYWRSPLLSKEIVDMLTGPGLRGPSSAGTA